jgi:hypothetical protein
VRVRDQQVVDLEAVRDLLQRERHGTSFAVTRCRRYETGSGDDESTAIAKYCADAPYA